MTSTKRSNTTKTSHLAAFLVLAAVLVWGLASCDLNPVVSIDQRVSTFASDLNSNRSSAYKDFHPDQTTEYQTLANSTYTFDTLFPSGSPGYTLQITDESSPSTGVFVTVTSAPGTYGTRIYLKLVMATTNSTDWRIVQLFMSNVQGSFSNTPNIY